MTRTPAFIYLAACIAFILAGVIYVFVIQRLFFRGGLALSFGIMVLFMMLILKTQAKTIVVYLDEKSIFVNDVRYLRNEIAGIETYDYDRRGRTRIYFCIRLKNGSRHYITDTGLFERRDQQRARLLEKMLKAMKLRLEIDLVHKNRRTGLAWYAAKNKPAS